MPGQCTTISDLKAQAQTVFGAGSPNFNSVRGKLENLQKQLDKGNVSAAQDQARNIVSFIQQKAGAANFPGTPAQVQLLISSILCYAGITPDSFLVNPTDAPQVLLNGTGAAAVSLQGNTVTVPTLITVTILPPSSSPLDTKLDVYPAFVLVTQSSPLTKPAVVAVCPSSTVPPSVLPRLRLGHQKLTGFEITPAADASFLDCSAVVGSTNQSRVSRWLNALASLVTPKPLYAKMFGGGIGGLASEFSPFGPVDPEVEMKGGIGGLASEFGVPARDTSGAPRRPTELPSADASVSRPRINTVVNGVCTSVDATLGTPVDAPCRPIITLTTAKGTALQNVPVGWAIGLGGGVAAPEVVSTLACGAFGSTAATTTDANGKAGVCWTLGPTAGTNTVIATPSAGGDAPTGVTFSSSFVTFTAIATQITPMVTATGGTFVFDALGHAGSGTCSNGLTPVLTYSGNGAVPTAVGVYTLTVTCGAGNPLYVVVTQTAQITITPAPTAAAVTCPASVVFTGSAITPCSGQVTAPGLSLTPTPAYTSNILGTATATVTYAGGGNYLSSSASATFKILYAQSACFASPISAVLPPATSAFQRNGIKLPVRCTLQTAQGTAVADATGDLLVQDRGTDGLGTPVTVFSQANVFRLTTGGYYGYELDVSPAAFVSTHYYFITANWSDGSKTEGWLLIK